MTKRKIKRRYIAAEIPLLDALADLMFDHGMEHSEALKYLGL